MLRTIVSMPSLSLFLHAIEQIKLDFNPSSTLTVFVFLCGLRTWIYAEYMYKFSTCCMWVVENVDQFSCFFPIQESKGSFFRFDFFKSLASRLANHLAVLQFVLRKHFRDGDQLFERRIRLAHRLELREVRNTNVQNGGQLASSIRAG